MAVESKGDASPRRSPPNPSRYEPVNVEFEEAPPEEVARAFFAAADLPDPRKRRELVPTGWLQG